MMFVVYDVITGEFKRRLQVPTTFLLNNLGVNESALPCAEEDSDPTIWVDHHLGILKLKADYTLSALPLPCTVTIEGQTYEVTEQPTFQFDAPGTYVIEVDAGPRFLKKEFEFVN